MVVSRELWDEIRGYMHISIDVDEPEDRVIEVGQNFSITCQIRNARDPNTKPYIIFKYIGLTVLATEFAAPVIDGDLVERANINKNQITELDTMDPGGDTVTIPITMQARKNMGGVLDHILVEQVASIHVSYELDLRQFFTFYSSNPEVFREIGPHPGLLYIDRRDPP
jgi:hypothetical protein